MIPTYSSSVLQVVYGIFLSFGELGPGNCLGLLASKSSPTAVRGQLGRLERLLEFGVSDLS